MKRALMLLVLVLVSAPLCAGLWDRDRPQPDDLSSTFDVITGRFARHPARFYEQRLQRVNTLLHEVPKPGAELNATEQKILRDALPLYDDAAVGLFRLQRYGEAIIILDRKFLAIEALRNEHPVEARAHEFRMHANKAECLKHRWLHSTRGDNADLKHAKRLLDGILEADGFNADAAWSLVEIEWLLGEPGWVERSGPVFTNIPGLDAVAFQGELNEDALVMNRVAGCIEYLSRRIAYEQGWDNVDVVYALCLSLELSGKRQEAVFAWHRVRELLEAGNTSAVTHELGATGTKKRMSWVLGEIEQPDAQRDAYGVLREAVKTWQQSRMDYLNAGLDAGRHPDTEPGFWAAWSPTDSGPPEPGVTEQEPETLVSTTMILGSVGALLFVLAMIFAATMLLGRGKAPHPTLDEL